MTIRSFKTNDTEKVIDFHERVLKETGAFAPGPWNEDMKNIEEVYLRPGGCFILIEENNKLIAMGALKILSKTMAEIKRMRVDTLHQRMGFGQKLLDYLIAFAKEKGIRRLTLDTSEVQIAAQNFYKKNGFMEYDQDSWNGLKLLLFEKDISL